MDQLIMSFYITIEKEKVSEMIAENGKISIIPFGGTVESELFTGTVLPGAADVQITNAAGIRHMCARYMFKGVDKEGNPCHLFVDNNGYFERGSSTTPFHACPTMMTDSPILAPYLHGAHFRSEGHPWEKGVIIKIFDTRQTN